MALGHWETDINWDIFDWIVFLISAVVLSFIMFNLIIQIVNKTFFKFQAQKVFVDLQQQLDMIIDFDKLLYKGK